MPGKNRTKRFLAAALGRVFWGRMKRYACDTKALYLCLTVPKVAPRHEVTKRGLTLRESRVRHLIRSDKIKIKLN